MILNNGWGLSQNMQINVSNTREFKKEHYQKRRRYSSIGIPVGGSMEMRKVQERAMSDSPAFKNCKSDFHTYYRMMVRLSRKSKVQLVVGSCECCSSSLMSRRM